MMQTNGLDFDERLRIGKLRELEILDILNQVKAFNCNWHSSTVMQDMNLKIDAWATNNDNEYSAQIKYRDNDFYDIGVALIRPYTNFAQFRQDYQTGNLSWDRDYKSSADLYVCRSGGQLLIAKHSDIVQICDTALVAFYKNGFTGTSFSTDQCELKLVRDQGKGYSEGQHKVICYIPFATLESMGNKIYRRR